jgi:hypothetical protein
MCAAAVAMEQQETLQNVRLNPHLQASHRCIEMQFIFLKASGFAQLSLVCCHEPKP